MKFHYESTGTDIIPNRAFWVQLPFLVKVMTIDIYTRLLPIV